MGGFSDFVEDTWDSVKDAHDSAYKAGLAVFTGGLSLAIPDAPNAPGGQPNPANDPAAIAERDRKTREEALRRLLGGQESTIATSPMGLASAAPVAAKSLLGA